MKRLNSRERDLANVATDLFIKGTPEWRIADYAHRRGFTAKQLLTFLNKINLIHYDLKFKIYEHFKHVNEQLCVCDEAKSNGLKIQHWLGLHDEIFRRSKKREKKKAA